MIRRSRADADPPPMVHLVGRSNPDTPDRSTLGPSAINLPPARTFPETVAANAHTVDGWDEPRAHRGNALGSPLVFPDPIARLTPWLIARSEHRVRQRRLPQHAPSLHAGGPEGESGPGRPARP